MAHNHDGNKVNKVNVIPKIESKYMTDLITTKPKGPLFMPNNILQKQWCRDFKFAYKQFKQRTE